MRNISLMLVVVCALTYACHCQIDFVSLGIQIGSIVFNLHSWNDGQKVPFLGASCTPSLKGRISSFKWKWDAKFSCNGRFSGITGSFNLIS